MLRYEWVGLVLLIVVVLWLLGWLAFSIGPLIHLLLIVVLVLLIVRLAKAIV